MKHIYNFIIGLGLTIFLTAHATHAAQTDITGPAGSGNFGNTVTVLPNGNIVVTDPLYDAPDGTADVGAAYLYDGATLALISTLTGSVANDRVGTGVTVLTNGNFVVRSTSWNGARGATTFVNGVSGLNGVVSSSNSIVGLGAGEGTFNSSVVVLPNGNFVLITQSWNGRRGAATFGNGTTGTAGTISETNSLVGSAANDAVASGGISVLANGNYVVRSAQWNGNRGAVTWGNGTSGTSGIVSSDNSLVGSIADDGIGTNLTVLRNGNYVVGSPYWDNGAFVDAGAATWGNGTTGITGTISSSNSLVGETASEYIGGDGITALTNGNYVVDSSSWHDFTGAATWGNGEVGTVGIVSSDNSLVGSIPFDEVSTRIVALTNGNYVVVSEFWHNGAVADAGAVTWGNGAVGTSGIVSSGNSLVGSSANDNIGSYGVTALTNGNYIVNSANWDNGALDNAGASTWGNGTSGITGTISSSNSLVGAPGDNVGNNVIALTNGNYVVSSALWQGVGAVTWSSGITGITGTVSSSNSLVGSSSGDRIGNSVVALTNGNYVVVSFGWDNGAVANAGAVAWGNGNGGTVGVVSGSNALVGLTANDNVGSGVTALSNGNYVVDNRNWDNTSPSVVNASSYTLGNGVSGTSGTVTSGLSGGNSVVGTVPFGTNAFAFDAMRNRLVVGRLASNTVSILSFTTTAIADGDLSDAANWSNGVPDALLTGIIPAGRTMTVSAVVNAGLIQIECGGNLTGGSSAAYIVGSVRKDFCAASNESFTYPLGDANNYSPLIVSNLSGTGNLTAAVTDNFMPGLPSTSQSLSRYWSLNGTGITANLTFKYVDADVNGSESDYKIFRRPIGNNALVAQYRASSVDPANNTITAMSVSQFSDWSASSQRLNPTAANVSVTGRVLTNEGAGLRNAIVYLTDSQGNTRKVQTGSFGNFTFEGIEAGQTVVLTVAAKRFTFAPRTLQVNDNVTDIDFTALR